MRWPAGAEVFSGGRKASPDSIDLIQEPFTHPAGMPRKTGLAPVLLISLPGSSRLGAVEDAVVEINLFDQIISAKLLSLEDALANQGPHTRRGDLHFLRSRTHCPSFHG